MKKKLIAIIVAAVLIVTGVVGGTIAYLTDTDEDVNVITLGNVEIDQIELQRDEQGALVPFEQDQRLLPGYVNKGWARYDWGDAVSATGTWNDLFASTYGVMDKFVFVENTGKTEAYYRTVIAVEWPEELSDEKIRININGHRFFDWGQSDGQQIGEAAEWIEDVEIDGVRYALLVATYTEPLMPDEISRPSFLQVALDKTATNEDMALLGGDSLEILVFTQAVQAYGFDAVTNANGDVLKSAAQVGLEEAFGVISVDNHPWIDASASTTAP